VNRTYRHLIYAVIWLLVFTGAVVIFVFTHGIPKELGTTKLVSQLGSAVWVMGFAGIFYSWARKDAPEHGRSSKSALAFALLWPFLLIASHAIYLIFTRGWRQGVVAILKFICFLMATGIVLLTFGTLLGAFWR
jgi:hypothetical protein